MDSQDISDGGRASSGEAGSEARGDESGERGERYPTGFGRGWIPAGREMGLPEGAAIPGADGRARLLGVLRERGTGAGSVGSDQSAAPLHPLAADPPPRFGKEPYDDLSGDPPPRAGWEPRALRHDGWTPVRKARFLEHLSRHGNVRAACAAAGLSGEAAYRLRRREALFARGWAAALVLAREHSVQVLADRALNGVSEPIFYRGEQVGARVRFDSRLLLAHLARLDAAAEDAVAVAAADRFDELLALVAGERPDEAMFDGGPEADPDLPMTRETYARHAQADGEEQALLRLEHEELGEEFASDEEAGEDEDEDEDGPDPVWDAGQVARAWAEDAWDGWEDRSFALVDGLDGEEEPPVEFKSLDPVNLVNFTPSAAAPWRYSLPPRTGERKSDADTQRNRDCLPRPLGRAGRAEPGVSRRFHRRDGMGERRHGGDHRTGRGDRAQRHVRGAVRDGHDPRGEPCRGRGGQQGADRAGGPPAGP